MEMRMEKIFKWNPRAAYMHIPQPPTHSLTVNTEGAIIIIIEHNPSNL
jgi:hypothetical protein